MRVSTHLRVQKEKWDLKRGKGGSQKMKEREGKGMV
jgi:hypothetical protein